MKTLAELGIPIIDYEGVCAKCGWTNVYRTFVKKDTHQIACPTCGTMCVLTRKGA